MNHSPIFAKEQPKENMEKKEEKDGGVTQWWREAEGDGGRGSNVNENVKHKCDFCKTQL